MYHLVFYCIDAFETVGAIAFVTYCIVLHGISPCNLLHWLVETVGALQGPHLLPDTATSAEQIYHIASFGSFFSFLLLLYITRSPGAQGH